MCRSRFKEEKLSGTSNLCEVPAPVAKKIEETHRHNLGVHQGGFIRRDKGMEFIGGKLIRMQNLHIKGM